MIVCLNIANLLLSRASTRRGDIECPVSRLVRLAWRLARQQLVEALTLTGARCLRAGCCLPRWAEPRAHRRCCRLPRGSLSVDAATRLAGDSASPSPSPRSPPCCVGDPAGPVRDARAADGGAEGWRPDVPGGATDPIGCWSSGLVIVQMALSIVLLAGAGLFVRNGESAGQCDRSDSSRRVLLVISASTARSAAGPARPRRSCTGVMLEAVAAIPGVVQAAGIRLDAGRHRWRGTADGRPRTGVPRSDGRSPSIS